MERKGDLRVRVFVEEQDAAEVVEVWEECFPDDPPRNDPRRLIERRRGIHDDLFLVGERDGRIVGTVLGGYDGVRGWIYHLAVRRDERRRGHARRLMAEIERRLRERGCPKINLQVRQSNREVLRFYRSIGYGFDDVLSLSKPFE